MNKNIFVSSTFKDFQRERDFIQNELTVSLNDRLMPKYMAGVYFVDLRWGIDTSEEDGLDKVVSICVDAVKEAKPYFIIMLGDNYGSTVDVKVAEAIYKSNGMSFDGRERSVTEMEIDASGLFNGENDRVLVLSRQITNLPSGESIYRQSKNAHLQSRLREKVISCAKVENVLYYDATVTENGLRIDETAIKDFMLDRLQAFYEQDITNVQQNLSLQQLFDTDSVDQNEVEETLRDIQQRLGDELVYLVYGPTGSGKSALMAELYNRLKETNKVAAQFVHYTSKVYNVYSVLQSLLQDVGIEPSDNLFAMMEQFDPNEHYIFFIDGYEAIHTDKDFDTFIAAMYVPDNVMFIVSTGSKPVDGGYSYHQMRALSKQRVLAIFQNTFASYRKELPSDFISYFAKRIPQSMQTGNVLLKIFIDTLCYLSMDDYKRLASADNYSAELSVVFKEKLDAFPKTVEQFLSDFISCDESGFNEVVLAAVALSHKGVNRKLLSKLLTVMDVCYSEADFSILRHQLRSILLVTKDDRYYLIHPSIRDKFLQLLSPNQVRYVAYSYLSLLGSNILDFDDEFSLEEMMRVSVNLHDYELLTNLLSLLYQYGEDLPQKGFLFALVTNQVFAQEVSEVFCQIAKQGNVYANAFLLRHCMPYLSQSYVEQARDMFGDMYNAIIANESSVDLVVVADVSYLYIAASIANLDFDNASELIRDVATRGLDKEILYKSLLRINALNYNHDEVEQGLKAFAALPTAFDGYLPLTLHGAYEVLHSILLLEANATFIDSNAIADFYEVVHGAFRFDKQQQDAAVVLVELEYLSLITGNPYPYEETIELAPFEAYCKPLYIMLNKFLHLQEATTERQVAELYDDYLLTLYSIAAQDVPASTLELFTVSHLFYRAVSAVDYEYNLELKEDTFTELARQFVDKIKEGGDCMMLTSHAIQSVMSALICGIDDGDYYDDNVQLWGELVVLLKQMNTSTEIIFHEMNNVINDATKWGFVQDNPRLAALFEQLKGYVL